MGILDFAWYYVVLFIFVLSVLVYVHEWGHYWVARRNGVRVDVFSIGFGPEIHGWTNAAGTRWKISAIPFGGYVKMFGERDVTGDDDESRELSAEEEAVSFSHKSLAQRTAIVSAGPLANFLFAIVVLAVMYGVVGSPRPLAAVGSVRPDSAAAEAGFQPGDRIESIDGQPIRWFEELREIVGRSAGVALTFTIDRTGRKMSVVAIPRAMEEANESGGVESRGRLGVTADPEQVEHERHDPLSAAYLAVERTATLTVRILEYVGQIIVGSRSAKELGGPLRIAQISGEMAKGGLSDFIFFMAFLSINLGLINLFPIPMLDGGHLLFYAIEAVLGRPLGPRAQEYGFRFGLILVLVLMVFVTWQDLRNLELF